MNKIKASAENYMTRADAAKASGQIADHDLKVVATEKSLSTKSHLELRQNIIRKQ